MEEKCKALFEKYVRSDSAIACLELSGYTSEALIRNLDFNQIDQIEDFVRHACTVMSSNNSRVYLGNVFSSHPGKFCFPIGVKMGIMLVVNELKECRQGKDVAVQTDLFVTEPCTMSLLANVNNDSQSNTNRPVHDASDSASRSSIDLTKDDVPEIPYKMIMNLSRSADLESPIKSIICPSNEASHLQKLSSPSKTLSESFASQLEHLKAHSTASAVRLVSRQFINACLVPGQHFHIDMEIVDSTEGAPRITGIFHCHLCRQKRTRSTAVRFSVSRNRYPVMSNVLSHLKIHFQVLAAHSTIMDNRTPVKRENTAGSESSTNLDSLSPFNLDHLLTNNVSLSSDIKF